MPAAASDSLFTSAAPHVQRAWDNTSLTLLKECPYKYYLTIHGGHRSDKESPALIFGQLLHAATEVYFKKRLTTSADHQTALVAAVSTILKATWQRVYHVRVPTGDPEAPTSTIFEARSPEELDHFLEENPAYADHSFIHEVALQWEPFDKVRSRDTLLHTTIAYLDSLERDPIEPVSLADGTPAVELSFRVPLPLESPDGEPYLYCGHIDRLGKLNGSIFIIDTKSTSSTISDNVLARYDLEPQFTGYLYGASINLPHPPAGAIVDLVQVAKGFTRISRSIVPRPPFMLDEWLENTTTWIKQAEEYARTGYYPRNETSCHRYGPCLFLSVCTAAPERREDILNTHFTKRFWNPLENR